MRRLAILLTFICLFVTHRPQSAMASQLSRVTCLELIERASRQSEVSEVAISPLVWELGKKDALLLNNLKAATEVPSSLVFAAQITGKRDVSRFLVSAEPYHLGLLQRVEQSAAHVAYQVKHFWYRHGSTVGAFLWGGVAIEGQTLFRLSANPSLDIMDSVVSSVPVSLMAALSYFFSDQENHFKIYPKPTPPPEKPVRQLTWQENWRALASQRGFEPQVISWQGRVKGELANGQELPKKIGFSLIMLSGQSGPELWLVLVDQEVAERARLTSRARPSTPVNVSKGVPRPKSPRENGARRLPLESREPGALAKVEREQSAPRLFRFDDSALALFYSNCQLDPQRATHFAASGGFGWQKLAAKAFKMIRVLEGSANLAQVRDSVSRGHFKHFQPRFDPPGLYGLEIDAQWTLFFDWDDRERGFVIKGIEDFHP